MFKLLTEEGKKKIAREYGARRAIVALFTLSLVLVVGIIGILPSYLVSSARKSEALERTRIIQDSGVRGDEAELVEWLSRINAELQTLAPRLDTDRPSVFVEEVVGRKSAGIRIERFLWKKDKEKVVLSINGRASDRQALIAFENQIRSSEHFSDVALPVSNLAQDRNIVFEIRFALAGSATSSQQTP